MPDYTDHLIAEKYKNLTPEQRALVDQLLTAIETGSTYPAVDRRRSEWSRAHYLGQDRRHHIANRLDAILGLDPPDRRRDARINLLMAISSGMVVTMTSVTAQIQPVNWLLIPTWALYVFGVIAYREHRLASA